jgi:hypothetical protein
MLAFSNYFSGFGSKILIIKIQHSTLQSGSTAECSSHTLPVHTDILMMKKCFWKLRTYLLFFCLPILSVGVHSTDQQETDQMEIILKHTLHYQRSF